MKKVFLGFVVGVLATVGVSAYADSMIKIVVNGKDITSTMDVPAQIIDGRTMVPIRFVSQNLGATVVWDEATKTVKIDSTGSSSSSTGSSTGSSAGTTTALGDSVIQSASVSSSTISAGDSAELTITANDSTTAVKVTTTEGNPVTSTAYTTNAGYRVFSVKVPLSTKGTYTLNVAGCDKNGYTTTQKTVTVTVEGSSSSSSSSSSKDDSTLKINDVSLNKKTIADGATLKVTVKTSTNAKEVVIEDASGTKIKSLKTPSSKGSSAYTWELSFKVDEDEGKQNYYVYVYDKDDNSVKEKFSFTVSDDEDEDEKLVIEDIDIEDDDEISEGDKVTITVKTNKLVDSVVAYDPDDEELDSTSSYTTKGSYRYFELEFRANEESKKYYVEAWDEDEDKDTMVSRKFTITFE